MAKHVGPKVVRVRRAARRGWHVHAVPWGGSWVEELERLEQLGLPAELDENNRIILPNDFRPEAKSAGKSKIYLLGALATAVAITGFVGFPSQGSHLVQNSVVLKTVAPKISCDQQMLTLAKLAASPKAWTKLGGTWVQRVTISCAGKSFAEQLIKAGPNYTLVQLEQ